MNSKYYRMAGLELCFESEEKIEASRAFEPFYSPESPGARRVRIIRRAERPMGSLLFENERRSYYAAPGVRETLTRYYSPTHGWQYFALKRCTESETTLYIAGTGPLWDQMVFDAFDFSDETARRGVFFMHCSFVYYGERAVLFAADKQQGKSTQARLWHEHLGAKIANGDRAAVELRGRGAWAYSTAFCGSSRICENLGADIAAIFLIKKAPFSAAKAAPEAQAYKRLLSLLSYNAQDPESSEGASQLCQGLVERVRIFELSCLPDETAVIAAQRAAFESEGGDI